MALDKKILSIDADDDGVDIKSFTIFSEENTKRDKNVIANRFDEIGEDLLFEIERKKMLKENEKKKYVKYVIRHSKKYVESQLMSYSLEDIKEIYDEIKNNRPLHKAFRFIFNL